MEAEDELKELQFEIGSLQARIHELEAEIEYKNNEILILQQKVRDYQKMVVEQDIEKDSF